MLVPFEAITRALSSSKTVVLPQMVNLASELYYATLKMYTGADDTTGTATNLAGVLLENIVKVGLPSPTACLKLCRRCRVASSSCVLVMAHFLLFHR